MADEARAGKAAQPSPVKRMMGLEVAAGLLGGQLPLAGALGIEPRSLRAKLNADRGINDDDLLSAAAALDARAARISAHAAKLREEAGVSA